MRFKVLIILIVALSVISCAGTNIKNQTGEDSIKIKLVDENASKYTRELFWYLKDIEGKHILFGQQHATDEGLTIKPIGDNYNFVGSTQSEVKNAVGDYPVIFGWDTNSLDGREKPGGKIGDISLTQEERISNLAKSMKAVHDLGGIITLSMHPNNFVTGNNYNDTTGNVVEEILPAGSKHEKFNMWLDNIAALSHKLKNDNGEAIPIIFRPFHEQTGSWFWWGASTTSPEEYKSIFRYTVDYLKDHGANNFLFAFSPGAGPAGDLERYLETYPGDDYVDILGIDNYDNKDNAGTKGWIDGLVEDLAMISKLAETRGKIPALTEYGLSEIKKNGNTLDWYTRVLDAIKADKDARKIAYMLTWANFGWPNNMFVPYRDIYNELGGNHELLPDFKRYYEDTYTSFAGDVKGKIYNKGAQLTTIPHGKSMYIVSPVSGTTVTKNKVIIRVKVNNIEENDQVTYSVLGLDKKVRMLPDSENNYYTALYEPNASVNNGSVELLVKYSSLGKVITEEKIKLYIKVPEISIYKLTFDKDIDGIKSNGTWPEDSVKSAISHEVLDNDGKLKFSVDGMPVEDWWQELKLELIDLKNVDLPKVNCIKFDVLIPLEGSQAQASAQLPPNWDNKFNQLPRGLNDFEITTIAGKEYRKFKGVIEVQATEETKGVALSFIGSQMKMKDIYFDNIELLNILKEEAEDPFLVDNFEGCMGEDSLLDRRYSSNGDPIKISLSDEYTANGDYSMKYDFTIGNMGYAGKQVSLGRVDWTGARGISLWLKHGNLPGNHLTVQIRIGGVSFEKNIDLSNAYEGTVVMPFTEFSPAHWESNQEAIIDLKRIEEVSQFALYMGGSKGEGTVFFDDIMAVDNEELPQLP